MQKRDARVLERWKKLVRGVLIRERVQRTYRLTWCLFFSNCVGSFYDGILHMHVMFVVGTTNKCPAFSGYSQSVSIIIWGFFCINVRMPPGNRKIYTLAGLMMIRRDSQVRPECRAKTRGHKDSETRPPAQERETAVEHGHSKPRRPKHVGSGVHLQLLRG